jgi:sulfur-oxidizing protein SoxX
MHARKLVLLAAALALTACATASTSSRKESAITDEQVLATLRSSFHAKGQANLERLQQDEVQKLCSEYSDGKALPQEVARRIQESQLATIKYPADGRYKGDWKAGEKIAQSGVGKQYTDDPSVVAGGNCYACHELTKQEIAFGTIGPSLYRFGRTRGFSPEMEKYAYGKVYNSEAYLACTNMPRFGHMGILTEQQIKDVVALLMDPQSPVNQ